MGVALQGMTGLVRGKKSQKLFTLLALMAIEVNGSASLWFVIYDNKTGEIQKVQRDDLEVVI